MKTLHFFPQFSISACADGCPGLRITVARKLVIILACICQLANSAVASEKLNTAVILDSKAYTSTQLFDVYKSHLGRSVTDQSATLIAEGVQQKYLDDGFAKPGFTILDGGEQSRIIRIKILEASISRVEYVGNAGPYRQRLDAIFSELPSTSSIRPAEFREAIQQARQLPGLSVAATTQRDDQGNGAFVLKLESDFDRFDGNVKLSNRGTREVGRTLLFARVTGNGLFNVDNASGLFVVSAKDSSNYNTGGFYTTTGFGNGESATLQGSHTAVQIVSGGVQLEQNRDLYSIKFVHKGDDGSTRDATIWGKIEIDNLDVLQDGAISREDRLRSFETGLAITRRDGASVSRLTLEIEKGLRIFDGKLANPANPTDPRRPDFTIARFQYMQSVQINGMWAFRWDGYVQHSPHTLPSIKRFKVGGNRIGRGFEAAAVSGDRGAGAKLELKKRLTEASVAFGSSAAYGFYDFGATWKNDSPGRESAASAGVGVSVRGKKLSGYLEIAKPLTHADADGNRDIGAFAELSFDF